MKTILIALLVLLFPVACTSIPNEADSPHYSDGYVQGFGDGHRAKEREIETGEVVDPPTLYLFDTSRYHRGYVQGYADGYRAKEREIEIEQEKSE